MKKSQTTDSQKTNLIKKFQEDFKQHMRFSVAHDMEKSSLLDKYTAIAYSVRDRMIDRWIKTQEEYYKTNPKRVYYFSLEFLMGRTLCNALINLNINEIVKEAMDELGHSMEELAEIEWDAGLGNGGLGRLAACFLDSMATLELPAYGFGIRYEFGMFKQAIQNNQQLETSDNWLRYGNPWEFCRAQDIQLVHFNGKVNRYKDNNGKEKCKWVDTDTVVAVPYDVPIPGYGTNTVNSLKLWASSSSREFNLESFNSGNYIGAIIDKHQSEVISKVLYPNDSNYTGKELRLKQQYFMVSASLQDIITRLERCSDDIRQLPEKVAIQLNDTHPSVAIPELMRILLDDYDLEWDEAWDITIRTFAYTNHTVLPEALEKWPVSLFENILPRQLEIIYEINQRFLDEISANYPGDFDRRFRMSIVEEGDSKNIRMAYLAIVGSYSVNGVAELHSNLLKSGIFKDFYEFYPEKFNNKTNGITPRRWLRHCNRPLAKLITEKTGDGWVKDLKQIQKLEPFATDKGFQEKWHAVKKSNKVVLAEIIKKLCDVTVDPDSLFDVQVKRIHEYKRQLLNLFHVITLYNRIKSGNTEGLTPRTVIFGGKAAPGYYRAKEIIHLINAAAHLINTDRAVGDYLKVVFLPNYGVSLAEKIFPGSDLSEQISTAGMEASGTGNMKFSLNGALTIGTLDGANIEIMEEVGRENIFIFGHTEEGIQNLRREGYNPHSYYENDEELRQVLDQIRGGYFSPQNRDLFAPIFNAIVHEGDSYCLLADYRQYIECQKEVSKLYLNQSEWDRKAILNVARMGKFSSDRVIQQYANEIWGISPCPIPSRSSK